MYRHDQRTVMTLDAGGTNFVFSAIRGNQNIVETICLPAVSDNLNGCLTVLKKGFSAVETNSFTCKNCPYLASKPKVSYRKLRL